MKLFHLSDLHIGKRVNEFSMIEDQKYILTQILYAADQEKPDGILISGDVYDRTIPTAVKMEEGKSRPFHMRPASESFLRFRHIPLKNKCRFSPSDSIQTPDAPPSRDYR